MVMNKKHGSIDEYLLTISPESKLILQNIRQLIKAAIPSATEAISYQLPAFKLKRTFIYFAAFQSHIGIYPPVRSDPELTEALKTYAGPKGNFKFPLNQPIPYPLIERVAVALAMQYAHVEH
jgi:uncharacterized protein YdhG (YjbR/CyaY superfamily)